MKTLFALVRILFIAVVLVLSGSRVASATHFAYGT